MFIRYTDKTLRYTLVLLLVIFCVSENRAQNWSLGVNAGIATYSYRELHDYQKYLQQELPVDETITESFPAYVFYSIDLSKQVKSWELGITVNHGSTGGRVYYEDYSGMIKADQLVTYNSVGFSADYIFFSKNNLLITGGAKMLFVFHKLRVENTIIIAEQKVTDHETFTATNLALQPNLAVKKNFKTLFLKAACGYEIQTSSEPQNKDDLYLEGENNDSVRLQGNGLRATLGFGLRF